MSKETFVNRSRSSPRSPPARARPIQAHRAVPQRLAKMFGLRPPCGTPAALCLVRRGGPPNNVQQLIAGPPSGLAGSAGSVRGYEPRLTTTHQLLRPASLECMRFLRKCDGGTASCGGTRSTRSVPSTTRGSRSLRRCKDTGPSQRRPTLGDVPVVAVISKGQCPLHSRCVAPFTHVSLPRTPPTAAGSHPAAVFFVPAESGFAQD